MLVPHTKARTTQKGNTMTWIALSMILAAGLTANLHKSDA
jgi:hypothetical protein